MTIRSNQATKVQTQNQLFLKPSVGQLNRGCLDCILAANFFVSSESDLQTNLVWQPQYLERLVKAKKESCSYKGFVWFRLEKCDLYDANHWGNLSSFYRHTYVVSIWWSIDVKAENGSFFYWNLSWPTLDLLKCCKEQKCI